MVVMVIKIVELYKDGQDLSKSGKEAREGTGTGKSVCYSKFNMSEIGIAQDRESIEGSDDILGVN